MANELPIFPQPNTDPFMGLPNSRFSPIQMPLYLDTQTEQAFGPTLATAFRTPDEKKNWSEEYYKKQVERADAYDKKADELAKKAEGEAAEARKTSWITGTLAAGAAGVNAGSQVSGPTTSRGAYAQTIQSGLSGAAAGAAAGAPLGGVGAGVGAAVGGVAGLIFGGIAAFDQLDASRQSEKRYEEAKRYSRRLQAQSRADEWNQIDYNRKQEAINSRWGSFQMAQKMLSERLNNNQALKERFLTWGR